MEITDIYGSVYLLKNTSPPRDYQQKSFRGKNMKRWTRKKMKCEEKRRKNRRKKKKWGWKAKINTTQGQNKAQKDAWRVNFWRIVGGGKL
jgi:hypothetical protein